MYTNKELAEALRIEIDTKTTVDFPRPYLGMSQIGGLCARHLWYYFRWVKLQSIDGRKSRIFSRGHHEEPRIIKILEDIGIIVDGTQLEATDCEGHYRGHIDGQAHNIPGLDKDKKVLLEFKGLANKYWKQLNNNNLKTYSKEYWFQTHGYMHYFGLDKCLFIATNKETEEWYIEFIDLDLSQVDAVQKRAVDIITSMTPPKRCAQDSSFYRCGPKWCEHRDICWNGAPVERSCRTCKYSEPCDDYEWFCRLHKIRLSIEDQKLGCENYDVLSV